MNLSSADFLKLKKLRELFLSGVPSASGDYWESAGLLDLYDKTFGERIRWKWLGVLNEIQLLGWTPQVGTQLLDWGCGTGVATQTFQNFWPIDKVFLWDRSRLALNHAIQKTSGRAWSGTVDNGTTLLLSHVLGELSPVDEKKLLRIVQGCQSIIWIEPGTKILADRLVTIRERLVESGFFPWAPCPHSLACGLSGANSRHWCHHFVAPPGYIFGNSDWGEFAKILRIDLRSLPVSYFVFDKRPASPRDSIRIGRGRLYKGHAKVLQCRGAGVKEETVLKRGYKLPLKTLGYPRLSSELA